MLQANEYQSWPYLLWLWRTRDFSKIQYRRSLDRTGAAKGLLYFLAGGMLVQALAGIILIVLGLAYHLAGYWAFGLAVIIGYPLIWSHLVVVPLEIGRLYLIEPKQKKQIDSSEEIFKAHPGVKIAVAGSYGKTSMKEILNTVLSEGKKVAATEANKNVGVEHAKFARKLTGDEEVLIIEYGEGKPGDVAGFTAKTHPTYGVITGLAPAHLDSYKTLEAAGEDIFSLAGAIPASKLFVNGESEAAVGFIRKGYMAYGQGGVAGWKVKDITVDLEGTSFTLTKAKRSLKLSSQLLGRHQVGVLATAAALAAELGLTDTQIERGIANTKPFEHRMQPYQLGGATIIDDTYNGNIEGIKAGCSLLGELPAKRKIYVTPGLVEQGNLNEEIHQTMGQYIAQAKPDLVVLMDNSACGPIRKGLDKAGYKGEVRIESDPLRFYRNLEHFVAAGDLILMQNDWPDNYD